MCGCCSQLFAVDFFYGSLCSVIDQRSSPHRLLDIDALRQDVILEQLSGMSGLEKG